MLCCTSPYEINKSKLSGETGVAWATLSKYLNYMNICAKPDIGAIRESFFVSQLSQQHQLHYHHQGDFLIDEKVIIEVGGTSKDLDNAYLAIDNIESGYNNVIPLWLFGFLY